MWFKGVVVPKYLQQRRRRWYAILEVPKDLQKQYDKRRLVQSLQTESKTAAERLVLPVIARWKAQFEAVRTGSDEPLEILANEWKEDYAAASSDKRMTYSEVLQDKVEYIQRRDPQKADTFYKIVTGETLPFAEHLEEWLSMLDNVAKTKDMKRADVLRCAVTFSHTHLAKKKGIERWAYSLVHEEGLKAATVRRIISACRGYWSYLIRADHIEREDNPFEGVIPPSGKSKTGTADKRQHFIAQDILLLLGQAEERSDDQLRDLICLAMWTGCRIEELCSLRVEDVRGDKLAITHAKSNAGVRTIPIHSQLAPELRRMVSQSSDGYVVSGLSFNKYGDRSNAIGKRFGRLKNSLGFGSRQVFHSIRKTVATLLENARVPEGISADILGHEKKTMTYGVYSGGTSFEGMQEAIEKLSYSKN